MNYDLLSDIEIKLDANSKKILSCLDNLIIEDPDSRLIEAMRYSALSGGKCLRSFFMIESGKAFGVAEESLIIPACCLEMIHSYSLIHDDLPSMDNDELRRGKPSCHIKFDEATAILAGDSLLTIAFEILSSEHILGTSQKSQSATSQCGLDAHEQEATMQLLKNAHYTLDSDKKLAIINVIAKSIGPYGMAGGQMLDMIFEKQNPDIVSILKMQRMKTAYLFAAAGAISAIIAGISEEKYKSFVSYSFSIGLVFQIVDDLLDESGNIARLGKKTSKDANRGKASLHSIMGVDKARYYAKFIADWGLKNLEASAIKNSIFLDITDFLLNREF